MRNADCTCGSGLKYKKCCGKPKKTFLSLFNRLPNATKIYYLDTNVWGELKASGITPDAFAKYFQDRNSVASLSSFNLIELSMAPKVMSDLDPYLLRARNQIVIPLMYDQVIEGETSRFPRLWDMRWLPLSKIVTSDDTIILQALMPRFKEQRNNYHQFGTDKFMHLGEMKANFPPLHGDEYKKEDTKPFAQDLGLDYLQRQFPSFLKSHQAYIRKKRDSLKSLLSLNSRSFFLFYKFYLHDKAPNESDFLDYAHVSYAPYCDVFVTERDIYNVLNHVKMNDDSADIFGKVRLLHINDFVHDIKQSQ